MAFFDDIGRRISQAGQGALKKTRDVADSVKINADISDQERRINTLFTQIGRTYFYTYESDPDEKFVELFNSVKEANARIEQLRKQLSAIKDTCRCSNCGAMNPSNSVFCTTCGAKIEAQQTVSGAYCINCGKMIAAGTRFCNFCGADQENRSTVNNNMDQTGPLNQTTSMYNGTQFNQPDNGTDTQSWGSEPESKSETITGEFGESANDTTSWSGVPESESEHTAEELGGTTNDMQSWGSDSDIRKIEDYKDPSAGWTDQTNAEAVLDKGDPAGTDFSASQEYKTEAPKERFCTVCGSKAEPDALFCTNCGNKF